MLINILGGDGGGKTTQVERLARWVEDTFPLRARTMAKRDIFITENVPECGFFGVPYERLAHEFLPQMLEESRALWLIYMNAVLIRRCPPEPGEIVFHDGYWHKHYATEAAMGLNPGWLLDVCRLFPEPDVTFVLDLDPRRIVERGHKHRPYESGCDFGCSDEAFIAHQDRVRSHILDLASRRGYPILDADRSVEDLFDDLRQRLEPVLAASCLKSA
jgi:thymidylate kinase